MNGRCRGNNMPDDGQHKTKHASTADLGRISRAFGFTLKGLRFAWLNEAAFRQEMILVILLAPAAFYLGTTAIERILLIAVLLLVLITELLNSAIEAIVDRFGEERHTLSGAAKDMGSAAVFFSLVLAGVTWFGFALARFS